MPLRRELLNAVVRITTASDLRGTGILLQVPSEGGRRYNYVVTADHVIRNQLEIGVHIPDPFAVDQPRLYEPFGLEDWRQPLPGVDLAVSLFPAAHPEGAVSAVPIEEMYPHGSMPLLGAEVYYVGIFAPLQIPMARSGTLGARNVPIPKDEQGYAYMANLLDCRSYGGFSGSPCFVQTVHGSDTPVKKQPSAEQMNALARPDGTTPKLTELIYAPRLFGIFTAHFTDDKAESRDGAISRLGVGVMVRHHEIWKALMSEELKEQRRQIDKALDAQEAQDGPTIELLAADSGGSEFERFETLTRKLVQTPKPDES